MLSFSATSSTAAATSVECQPTLLSSLPPTLHLLAAATTLLVLAVSYTHTLSGWPLSQLGVRPPGRGLWSYLVGHCGLSSLITGGGGGGGGSSSGGASTRGTLGYDSSLGGHAPPIRVAFHLVGSLLAWALLVIGPVWMETFVGLYRSLISGTNATSTVEVNYCTDPLTILSPSVLSDGIVALAAYFGGLFLYHMVTPGVSHPGGPREHKIRRMPNWDDQTTSVVEEEMDPKNVVWRCAVAEDSHRVTLRRFGMLDSDDETTKKASNKTMESDENDEGLKLGMTGEPSGRQMWTWTKTDTRDKDKNTGEDKGDFDVVGALVQPLVDPLVQLLSPGKERNNGPKSKEVDEKLVQEMACGGRPAGFNPSVNPNSCDQIFRAQQIRSYLASGQAPPSLESKPKTAPDAARKAAHFYSMLQTSDGHWAGDYGGPHFLLPGLVVAWYVMGQPETMIDAEQRALMRHYLTVHQQSDGGWGTHIESPSTMFGTTVSYVALRLLGAEADDDVCKRGQKFIQDNGGAIMTSSWAKFWLCLLGCMEWEGHNSVPPEMWLLPNWLPFHPGRLWCHCRMVYLPMGYLYGSRFVYSEAESDPLIASLRKELYCEDYATIPWSSTRHKVAPMDNYSPLPLFMKLAQDFLAFYESWSIFQPFKNKFRKLGLKFCVEYMAAEDLQTNFIDIGPVNKALNLVSAYHAAGNDINATTVKNHMMRIPDYLWVAEDGMKMQGYNGSQCWDTSFAIQALSECKLLDEFPVMSRKVWTYLERTQILSTEVSRASPAFKYESAANREKYYRHVSEGGWPFSTSAHGWPISDCTGEGLKGVLALLHSKSIVGGVKDGSLPKIEPKRLHDAVNVIVTLQNEDGGWATYENNRGFGWYEQLNPSEVFGDIMIDYSYVECSMASLTALAEFHEMYPDHRSAEIKYSLQRGREFMKSIQRENGSWYGSWACCFCYGCWFGIEGLMRAGEPSSSPVIQKCCQFLISHQRSNGGWGEDFTSCYDKDYAENGMDSYGDDGSGVVNTAWALLALSAAKYDDVEAIRRGVQYLISRQLPCGDWPQEGIAGVFNRACGITYTAYRNVFPIWALGRCSATYGAAIDVIEDEEDD